MKKPNKKSLVFRCVNPRCSSYKELITVDDATWQYHEDYDKWLCDQIYCTNCGRYGCEHTPDDFTAKVRVSNAQGKKSY